MGYNDGFLDDIVSDALRKKKNVRLFLCRDKEGGYGIKVDGVEIARNLAWESFEIEIDLEEYNKIRNRLGLEARK